MLRAVRRFRETQNTRPRIRNKPAVAETLNKTAGNGFHPVQDLPVEDNKALILSPSGPKRKRRQLA
jgi:hypothetical protein